MDGSNPFTAPIKLPLWEGASIVMVGTGVGTVSIYDAGLAANTFGAASPGINYMLNLPGVAAGRTLIDNIGADGQHGVYGATRKPAPLLSDEQTWINAVQIAGPGSPYNDSDWNGSSGFPGVELWDDTGHDITVPAHGFGVLNVKIFHASALQGDCLVPVANVVEED